MNETWGNLGNGGFRFGLKRVGCVLGGGGGLGKHGWPACAPISRTLPCPFAPICR